MRVGSLVADIDVEQVHGQRKLVTEKWRERLLPLQNAVNDLAV